MAASTSITGIGIGYRPTHYRWIAENKPKVPWFEVITENFLGGGGKPRRFLEKLRADYPLVFHGVGLSLGSIDPISPDYLKRWQRLIKEFQPAMVSDHLCWTSFEGHNSHDLLPVPYTLQSLAHIRDRINLAQDTIQRPLLIENPSVYVGFAHNDMTEAEFLRELVQSTGCKLLLDVNNLFVNACNVALDPLQYLETIPRDAVAQFHLAGHSVQPEVRIDTHDHPICDEVWALYKLAAQRWPQVPTLIEWDDHIPEFPQMLDVTMQAQQQRENAALFVPPHAPRVASVATPSKPTMDNAHQAFMQLMTSPTGIDAYAEHWPLFAEDLPVPRHIGLNVYNQAYFLRIRDVMKDIFPGLFYLCEETGFDVLVADYLKAKRPSHYNIKFVGANFADFLAAGAFDFDFGVPATLLADIARLEWAQALVFDRADEGAPLTVHDLSKIDASDWDAIHLDICKNMELIQTSHNAHAMITAAKSEIDPPAPETGEFFHIVCRINDQSTVLDIDRSHFLYLQYLRSGACLSEAVRLASNVASISGSEAAAALPQMLADWCSWGLIVGYRK